MRSVHELASLHRKNIRLSTAKLIFSLGDEGPTISAPLVSGKQFFVMSLNVSDIFSPKARQVHAAERYRTYRENALSYLGAEFAPAMRILDQDQALAFIDAAYDIGTRKGLSSERDHFHHLNICMFWGLHFYSDPQYQELLRRAGWERKLQQPRFDPNALRIEIKRRHNCMSADFSDPRRIIEAFAGLYDSPDASYQIEDDLRLIAQAFPAQFAMVPASDWVVMAETVRRRCVVFGVQEVDLSACVGLAAIFGAGFVDDPRFHWAEYALRKPRLQEKRIELGGAVQRYWAALSQNSDQVRSI